MTLIKTPPEAERRPVTHHRFGTEWVDDYAWLRDKAYPEVKEDEILAYLNAENAYFEENLAQPQRDRIDVLHAEFKGRIKDEDESVPVRQDQYYYHWAFAAGAQYRTWFRRAEGSDAASVILDENHLAQEAPYFNLRGFAVSPNGRLLAYATDSDGSERYRLHLRDLETGEEQRDLVHNLSGSIVWRSDSKALFAVDLNDKLRPFRVRLHTVDPIGSAAEDVFEEDDPAFFVSLGATRSRRFVTIAAGTHVSREVHVLDQQNPDAGLRCVTPRRDGHRYWLDHGQDRFWILTNDQHPNFRLVSAPVETPKEDQWREEVPAGDRNYLQDVSCFSGFMVVTGKVDGLTQLRIRDYHGTETPIQFEEPVYTARVGDNREFDTDRVRLSYSSMVTPPSVIDYVVKTGERHVRKTQEIPSGYDKSQYATTRIDAATADGVKVPVTLVHRKDFVKDGSGKLFLYGYGAYGSGTEPHFSASRLSLLDRGFCFAIAHVRGGDELGQLWYEAGKLEHKPRTFNDFIAAAEELISRNYVSPGNIAIMGGSAGGMLIGAVVNTRPDLWRCAIASVPFVDVLNTMLDESLPLTPIEWPEWGNPIKDKAAFDLIMGYSPYETIKHQDYPALMVTAGISDPRVTYWEPAKFVAKLRAYKTDSNWLFLKTNMDAGHFGASGRYDSLKELAEQYAFVLRCFE
ncbi:MAG: S9 family peptidase [Pseudomonadota bacterium]